MSRLVKTKPNKGFSLIEVLVALVILSIGLLGVAALQMTSLQTNRDAYFRTQAVIATTDLLERMRANKIAANSGKYSVNMGVLPSGTKNCGVNGAACTTDEMATYDLISWKCGLGIWSTHITCTGISGLTSGALSSGDGSVSEGAGGIFTITVQYKDQSGTMQDFEVKADL